MLSLDLIGKRAIITGGAEGIGFKVAEMFHSAGAELLLCVRSTDGFNQLKSLQNNLGHERIHILQGDAQNEGFAKELVSYGISQMGGIDILVNNSAGAEMNHDSILRITENEWMNAFSGKLLGYIRMANLVIPDMITRDWGRVINIIGLTGKFPIQELCRASVVNSALMNYTHLLSQEVAGSNITVNAVNPGFISTRRSEKFLKDIGKCKNGTLSDGSASDKTSFISKIPGQKFGSTDDVASLICFLVSSHAGYLTGSAIPIDGGFSNSIF